MTELTYKVGSEFAAEEKQIRDGLARYADQAAGLERLFTGAFCYDGDKMVGGVVGHLVGGSLGIKMLWVDENYRGRNIARKLMQDIEQDAADKGNVVAFVDTMGYQAPEFYEKVGYTEDARIKDFYVGHDRIFFRKALKAKGLKAA